MTGLPWGFVKTGHRVQYVSCDSEPFAKIRIGALWGKKYETRQKPFDIVLQHKINPTTDGYLAAELKRGLLLWIRDRKKKTSEALIKKIIDYPIDTEIAIMIAEAVAQKKKWGDSLNPQPQDYYLQDCQQEQYL